MFERAAVIDRDTAFVLQDGLYGILDVRSSSSIELPNSDYALSYEETTDIVAESLLMYYQSYLDAINNQDLSYLGYCTDELRQSLADRIFGVNSEDIFALDQIQIDMDTFNLNMDSSPMRAEMLAAFEFGYQSRDGGAVTHGANIQRIEMLYNELDSAWMVSASDIVLDMPISDNTLTIR
jgi:hypothetical protein